MSCALRKIIILRKKIYAYGANNPVRYIDPGVRKMKNKILPTFIGVVIINFCLAFLLFRYNGTDLGIKNTIILLSDDLCVQIPYIIV